MSPHYLVTCRLMVPHYLVKCHLAVHSQLSLDLPRSVGSTSLRRADYTTRNHHAHRTGPECRQQPRPLDHCNYHQTPIPVLAMSFRLLQLSLETRMPVVATSLRLLQLSLEIRMPVVAKSYRLVLIMQPIITNPRPESTNRSPGSRQYVAEQHDRFAANQLPDADACDQQHVV